MSLEALRDHERQKYETIYSDERYRRYGTLNHGSAALEWLLAQKPLSVCDVGTGRGQFPRTLKEAGVPFVIGIDFALPKGLDDEGPGLRFRRAPAHSLPLLDDEVEWLTSFDTLEHLVPGEVEEVLTEFKRVASKGWLFSVAYRPSKILVNGENLHPTVKPEEWWVETIERISGSKVEKWKHYLTCRL